MAALALIGTLVSAVGAIKQGQDAKAASDYEAAGRERQGTEAMAASQRQMQQQQQKTDFQLSEIRSKAAASGAGGLGTPGINDIYGDTAQYGDFLARSQLYQGQNAQAGGMDAAAASRFKGQSAYDGSILEGIGKGLSGAAGYYGATSGGSGSDYFYGKPVRNQGYGYQ